MKIVTFLLAMTAVYVCACASSNNNAHCIDPAGLYNFHYVQQGTGATVGDCNAIDDFSLVLPIPTSNNCTVISSHTSDNNCSGSDQETCSYTCSNETTFSARCLISDEGTFDSNQDGSQLSGTLSRTQYNVAGAIICRGLYTWTSVRIHN
jgi:hypothetical protein